MICDSQQRSVAGYKGLLLAENRGTHRQTLPILKYRYLLTYLHKFAEFQTVFKIPATPRDSAVYSKQANH